MARQTSCRIFSIILNSSYDSLGPQKLKKTEIVDYEVLKGNILLHTQSIACATV